MSPEDIAAQQRQLALGIVQNIVQTNDKGLPIEADARIDAILKMADKIVGFLKAGIKVA